MRQQGRNAARSFDSRQGPAQSSSFSYSASSDSSSYLSSSRNKALSPKSNFNPFSPLSPDPTEQELEDLDDDQGTFFAMEGISVSPLHSYSRKQLLDIAHQNQAGWTKPPGMGSLESWFGKPTSHNTPHDDPAIASIGFAPNRRGGGYGEGFGYGGGIGGKGLSRGGRHAGTRRHDQDQATPKEVAGGTMGKFAVRQTGERMKLGGDEHGKPKNEWRRDHPPHQAPRQERRPWNARHEEAAAEPAWMDDQPEQDPAIVQIRDDSLVQFTPGEDRIAAHKRAMKGPHEEHRPLVGFFGGDAPDPIKAKPVKDYNAANYLLRNKEKGEHEKAEVKDTGSSRFQRFFGNPSQVTHAVPSQGRFSAPPQSESPHLAASHANSSTQLASDASVIRSSNAPPPHPTLSHTRPVEVAAVSHHERLIGVLAPSRSPAHVQPEYNPAPSGPSHYPYNQVNLAPSHVNSSHAYQLDTRNLSPTHTNQADPIHGVFTDYQADTRYQRGLSHAPPPGLAHNQQYPPQYGGPPVPQQGYLPQLNYPVASSHAHSRPPPPGFAPPQQQQFQQHFPQQYQGRPPMPGSDAPQHVHSMYAMLNSR